MEVPPSHRMGPLSTKHHPTPCDCRRSLFACSFDQVENGSHSSHDRHAPGAHWTAHLPFIPVLDVPPNHVTQESLHWCRVCSSFHVGRFHLINLNQKGTTRLVSHPSRSVCVSVQVSAPQPRNSAAPHDVGLPPRAHPAGAGSVGPKGPEGPGIGKLPTGSC